MSLEKRKAAFIEKATRLHDHKYDYSKVIYAGTREHVIIGCPVHGDILQRPDIHLKSSGCPQCGASYRVKTMKKRQSDPTAFFQKAVEVHGDVYDYTNSVYELGSKPINIKCRVHGEFTVGRAEKHIMRVQGCPHCISSMSHAERVIADCLTELNVAHNREYTFTDCRSHETNKKLRFDFFIPQKNILLEFHGEQHFKRSPMMHPGDRFERMQEHDRIKAQYAHDNGFTFVVFTTKDMVRLRELVAKLVS